MAYSEPDSRLPAWCAGDEWCPITCAAAVVGRRWHPVLVHRLLEHGPLRFNELKEHADGISDKVLSESLDDLQEKQLVEREVEPGKPVRVEYSLTEYGESLEPLIEDMVEWGETYLVETDRREESIV